MCELFCFIGLIKTTGIYSQVWTKGIQQIIIPFDDLWEKINYGKQTFAYLPDNGCKYEVFFVCV